MTEEEKRETQQQLVMNVARLAEIAETEDAKRQKIRRLRDEACVCIAEWQGYEKQAMQEAASLGAKNIARQMSEMKAVMDKGDAKELERLLCEMEQCI